MLPAGGAQLAASRMRGHFTYLLEAGAASDQADRRAWNSKVKRGLPLGHAQTVADAKSPAPIYLGGLRRLNLGHASAREMRASVPNQPENGMVEELRVQTRAIR